MRVLVTGGLGYIGSHTVNELIAQGHETVIVDNLINSDHSVLSRLKKLTGTDSLPFYETDLTDYDGVEKIFKNHAIDGVIHFAALKSVGESVHQPLRYYHNNLQSLIVVLETMLEQGVGNFIFSSTCTVYGESPEQPLREDMPTQPPKSPYGTSKLMCEKIIQDTLAAPAVRGNEQILKAAVLRYFNPIGAHPSSLIGELPMGVPSNLVPFITQTAAGIRDELTIYGDDYDTPDGTNIRDYLHVVDLARAHIKALEYIHKQEGSMSDIFNIGTGKGVSVLELVKLFEETTGVKLNYRIGERREGDLVINLANPSKAEQVLGWKAELSLQQALQDAWRWQQSL